MRMKFYVSLRKLLRDEIFISAPDYLRGHEGKVIRICVGPVRRALRVDEQSKIELVHPEVWANAQVKMPVARLCGDRDTVYESSGDSKLLKDFAALVENEDIGFVALIEKLYGAKAGSAAQNVSSAATRFGADVKVRLGEQFAHWLTQESGILPDPAASRRLGANVREFAAKVENLRRLTVAER